jgi:polysaccharide deacetylase family protein (PEP-CTERM system associated)
MVVKHAFTVDLEDWFNGIPIPADAKSVAERRLHIGTDFLLEILDRHQTKATFFALGSIAHDAPSILQKIASAGHEVGSHGVSHDLIYEMGPYRFREETRSSIRSIEDCIGQAVRCYRAAYFSITPDSMWALDILASEGVRFDSSIFPVNNWRYGNPDFSRFPIIIRTDYGPIVEFPMSTTRMFSHTFPTSGGAYFRIYPYWLTRRNIRATQTAGTPAVFYLHPWELDPDHPRTRFHPKAMITHYINLRSTAPRLERLLCDFEFTTLGEVLEGVFPGTNS